MDSILKPIVELPWMYSSTRHKDITFQYQIIIAIGISLLLSPRVWDASTPHVYQINPACNEKGTNEQAEREFIS